MEGKNNNTPTTIKSNANILKQNENLTTLHSGTTKYNYTPNGRQKNIKFSRAFVCMSECFYERTRYDEFSVNLLWKQIKWTTLIFLFTSFKLKINRERCEIEWAKKWRKKQNSLRKIEKIYTTKNNESNICKLNDVFTKPTANSDEQRWHCSQQQISSREIYKKNVVNAREAYVEWMKR